MVYLGLVTIVWQGWRTIVSQRRQIGDLNTTLQDQLNSAKNEMALVDEVAQIITSTPNLGKVYEKFALETKKLVHFDRMAISEINESAERLS